MSFGNLLWESVVKSWGGMLTFLSFGAALLVFYLTPKNTSVAINHVLPIFILLFFLAVVSLRAAWISFGYSKLILPKVIHVKEPPKAYKNAFALFLVKPTPLLSHDAIISVYYLEDGLEQLVGVGKVVNVQNDKKVQIVVTNDYDFGEKLNNLKRNSKDELDKLVIKSSVPSFILENVYNG
ncbi:hypothetical protein [Marinobacter antarcticus]|nr:hypothetical protein [Marinobacter antarcticus]